MSTTPDRLCPAIADAAAEYEDQVDGILFRIRKLKEEVTLTPTLTVLLNAVQADSITLKLGLKELQAESSKRPPPPEDLFQQLTGYQSPAHARAGDKA